MPHERERRRAGGNFGVRAVGIYFDAAQSNASDPVTASEPGNIYMYPVKFMPYSLAAYNEGLDTLPYCAGGGPGCTANEDPHPQVQWRADLRSVRPGRQSVGQGQPLHPLYGEQLG